jgi:heat shock protein HtpX
MNTFTNHLKTGFLMAALTGLVLLAGFFVTGGSTGGIVIALVVAGGMNVVGYFFSDKIALAAMKAQEVGPEHPLYQITEGLVQRADMPMPRVYISPQQAPNAFATGRNPRNAAVCATEGLLQVLDRDEVAGVMAHELAHVKHRDILIQTVAATVGGAISALGYIFMFGGSRENVNPIAAIATLILGPLAAGLLQAMISRQREFAADTEGANILGDPMPLATALEKIHNLGRRVPMDTNPAFNALMIAEPLNFRRQLSGMFSTHPPLEARLSNLIGRETTGMFRFA